MSKAKVVDPQSVGVDPTFLKGYEDAMETMIAQGGLSGCAGMIWRHGKLIEAGAWGHDDFRGGRRFDNHSLCRMYCATKSFVAVALMTLVEEGQAHLDDPLSKYIPEFANVRVKTDDPKVTVAPKRPILLKHLLVHTSGLDYPVDIGEKPADAQAKSYQQLQEAARAGKLRPLKKFCEVLATIPLSCHPGFHYHYGVSYDVLGRVLEVITGKSLDQVLLARVFRPLGMNDTMWAVPKNKIKRLGPLYASAKTWRYVVKKGTKRITNGKALSEVDPAGNRSCYRKGKECKVLSGGGFMGYPSGGLVSTVADTAKFTLMLYNYGVMENGKRMLKKKTVQEMEINRLLKKYNGEDRVCYLGNVGCFREGADEFGMGGAACTYWQIDRKDDTATVWFTQHMDMPDFTDMKNIDNDKADLWKCLHEAIQSGSKRKPMKAARASKPSKKVRKTIAK